MNGVCQAKPQRNRRLVGSANFTQNSSINPCLQDSRWSSAGSPTLRPRPPTPLCQRQPASPTSSSSSPTTSASAISAATAARFTRRRISTALAREGARFTDAYAACPVCSPTRASIMTGQWPQRTGITDYIGAPIKPETMEAQHDAPARALHRPSRARRAHAGQGDEGRGLRHVLRRQMASRSGRLVAGEPGLRHQHGRHRQAAGPTAARNTFRPTATRA